MSSMDTDGSGSIDFEEFHQMMTERVRVHRASQVCADIIVFLIFVHLRFS